LTVTGGNIVLNYNGGASLPALGQVALSWNYTAGGSETDLWNTSNSPIMSFVFWQRTNAPGATRLLDISPTGNVRAYGGIDNTVIGGTTPAAGTFTTINANGRVNIVGASTTSPPLSFTTTGNGTDANIWDFVVSGLGLNGRLINDAYGAVTNWVTVTRSGMTLTGIAFGIGISFGSVTGASVTDLSKHINLYGGSYGFAVTGGRLNYNVQTGAVHGFNVNGVSIFVIQGATVVSGVPLSVTGTIYASSVIGNQQGSAGSAALVPSDATHTGFLAFYYANGTRLGYIGNQASTGVITMASENGTTGWSIIGTLAVSSNLTVSGQIQGLGNVLCNSACYVSYNNSPTFYLIGDASNNYLFWTTTYYNYWNKSNGWLYWVQNSTAVMWLTSGGQLNVNGSSAIAGSGTYMTTSAYAGPGAWSFNCGINANATAIAAAVIATTSDRRHKSDIVDLTDDEAIAWVMAGRPRKYRLHGAPFAGFVAQEDVLAGGGRSDAIQMYDDDDPLYAESDGLVPPGKRLSRDYNQDNAYLTKVVQYLLAEVAALKAERRLAA
jgi:hypothetical protein